MDGYAYRGIDVSALQGSISDWSVLNADFIIHRCGVGNDYIDANYSGNKTAIKQVNLAFLPYHFVYPINLPNDANHINRDPNGQAEYHFGACQSNACIDIEWAPPAYWNVYNMSANQINDWCLTYLQRYQQLSGCLPIIYTFPWFASVIGFSNDYLNYPLWIASYNQNPQIPKPWTSCMIWQNGGGSLKLPNGIPCDQDVANDLSLFI